MWLQHRKAECGHKGQRGRRGNMGQRFPRGGKMLLVIRKLGQQKTRSHQGGVHAQRKAQHKACGLVDLEQVKGAALALRPLLTRLLAEQKSAQHLGMGNTLAHGGDRVVAHIGL